MRRCAGRNILPLGLLYGEHCVRDQQEFQLAFEQAARAGINEVDVKAGRDGGRRHQREESRRN